MKRVASPWNPQPTISSNAPGVFRSRSVIRAVNRTESFTWWRTAQVRKHRVADVQHARSVQDATFLRVIQLAAWPTAEECPASVEPAGSAFQGSSGERLRKRRPRTWRSVSLLMFAIETHVRLKTILTSMRRYIETSCQPCESKCLKGSLIEDFQETIINTLNIHIDRDCFNTQSRQGKHMHI